MKVSVDVTLTIEVRSQDEAERAAKDLDQTLGSATIRLFLLQRGYKLVGHTIGKVKKAV
jgi:hypothetical protein